MVNPKEVKLRHRAPEGRKDAGLWQSKTKTEMKAKQKAGGSAEQARAADYICGGPAMGGVEWLEVAMELTLLAEILGPELPSSFSILLHV